MFIRSALAATIGAASLALVLVACGGGGNGEPKARPAAPTNVTATPGPGYVKVEWAHSGEGVQSFHVNRTGGVAGQQSEPFATVGAGDRSFIDYDVDLSQGYRYSVTAVTADSTSDATPHSGEEAVVSPGIDLVMGHWAPLIPAFGIFNFYLFVPESDWPQAGTTHTVTVTGPGGYSRTFEVARSDFENGIASQGAQGTLATGEYTASLTVGANTYTAAHSYDSSTVLERVQVNPIVNPTANSIEVTWEPVPGAVSYFASLYEESTGPGFSSERTTSTSAHFIGLDLAPGVYYARVNAYTWDLTASERGQLPEKPATAHASQSTFRGFAITEPGACADPDAPIAIADDTLRQRILELHGLTGPTPTCAEMLQVLSLIVPERGITSLEGLQHATNLYNLSIYGNEITDLSPLADLTDLLAIFAHDNPITSLEPVAGLTKLRFIEVSDNDLADLSPLAGLDDLVRVGAARLPNVTDISSLAGKSIASLWLNGSSNIADFSPIQGLTNLNTLLVGDTGFDDTDMQMLTSLPSVARLQVWGNPAVTDLSPVSNLPLYEIDIGGTSVTDLTPLHGMAESMQNLSAYWLGLDGADIEFLADFTNLSSLNLAGNALVNLATLVTNPGLGDGDTLLIDHNCLDLSPGSEASQQLETLLARGVEVTYEPQRTCEP